MISNYLRVIRRRWYVIPAVIVIAALALVVGVNLSATATSRVIVPFPGDQSDQNFQGVASSFEVAKQVIHDLHLKGTAPQKLLGQVTVTLEYGTNIYDISVKDSNQARALRICDAWTTDTIALYTKLNTAPASQAFLAAQQQLASAHQNIAALQAKIVAFEYAHPELVNTSTTTSSSTSGSSSSNGSSTGSNSSSGSGSTGTSGSSSTSTNGSQSNNSNSTTNQTTNNTPGTTANAQILSDLKLQLADAQTIYNQLAGVMSTAQLSNLDTQQKAYAQVLDPAVKPASNVPLLAAFTLLLGLLVGVGAIFAWDYFDNSLNSSANLEDIFGETAVVQIAGRPSRRELRSVAAGIWALPAPSQSQRRPGQWPGALVVSTLASIAANRARSAATDTPPPPADPSAHSNSDR